MQLFSRVLLFFSLFPFSESLSKQVKTRLSSLICAKQWRVRTLKVINIQVSFKKEPRFKMRDTSGPYRFEVLESNVGGMKVEFSHIRA